MDFPSLWKKLEQNEKGIIREDKKLRK